MDNSLRCKVTAWSIWIVAAVFYAYEFFLRVSPSVMTPELMQTFNVHAVAIGTLSAFYYYAYASMQIPVGILFDTYGIRRLLTGAAIMVSIGSVMFATTKQLWVADLGRILMGAGSAFSFVACIKLVRNWFPPHQLAIVIGLTNMLGAIGAINAGRPLSVLVENLGWQPTMLYAGVIGALLALLISIIVRDSPARAGCENSPEDVRPREASIWLGLRKITRSRRTWLVAIYGGLMVAPISAFTELWGISFLMTLDHLSKHSAANISMIVFYGIAFGGPIHGWISGKIGRRKPVMFVGSVVALITFSCILFIPELHPMLLSVLLFTFGFFTSTMLLIFAINTENNPAWVSGVTIGFTNMVVMAGGAIFQPLVGWLLDLSRNGADSINLTFSGHAYQMALGILPLCQILALILLKYIPETYCGETKKTA